mgnify:CR=1 FL=1
MFGDVSFENIQMLLINFHAGFDFKNFLFCGLIFNPCDPTELKPPIIMFTIAKLSQHDVNCAAIVRKKDVMWYAKLYEFVGYESEDKR